MKNLFPALALSGILFLFSASVSGCSSAVTTKEKDADPFETESIFSNETDLFGGGMVCNATLLSGGIDEVYSYELPVLSPKELKSIELEEIHTSGEGNYKVLWDHVSTGGIYKGWYYYYIHLKVGADQSSRASFQVDSLDLMIDGVSYQYSPRSFVFYNTKGLFDQDLSDESGILLYLDSPEVILSAIPSDPQNPVRISLEVNEDCVLEDFLALDFLNITNLTFRVNDIQQEKSDTKGLSLQKGDALEISFNLEYQEGFSGADLIKTSRILKYRSNGKEYLLNEPQGFALIEFEDDQMIHQYIDQEILADA